MMISTKLAFYRRASLALARTASLSRAAGERPGMAPWMFAPDSAQRAWITQSTTAYQKQGSVPDLPDFNTSVQTHEHKLARPVKKPATAKPKTAQKANMGSLIPETLQQMENDEEFQLTAARLRQLGQAKLTREERKKRQRALDHLGVPNFREFLRTHPQGETGDACSSLLRKIDIGVLQLNIGLYCNQACSHCHVESSPRRKEMMDRDTADRCLQLLDNSPSVHTLDITGGAPELCSQFRHLAAGGRRRGLKVIDRCNLTVLLEPGQEDTAEFLAGNGITVVASLPCYSAKNVNLQRGSQVFQRSVRALQILNEVGYGKPDSDLELNLVYNPLGAFLPPQQGPLEAQYKAELFEAFGIQFNNLFTITNMPIKRFTDFLSRRGELEDYMQVLVRNFNPGSVEGLMCRNHLNVGWDGRIFDCDFNQQLDMPGKAPRQTDSSGAEPRPLPGGGKGPSVWDIESTSDLVDLRIITDNHCFGCTAGSGSSCQGATV